MASVVSSGNQRPFPVVRDIINNSYDNVFCSFSGQIKCYEKPENSEKYTELFTEVYYCVMASRERIFDGSYKADLCDNPVCKSSSRIRMKCDSIHSLVMFDVLWKHFPQALVPRLRPKIEPDSVILQSPTFGSDEGLQSCADPMDEEAPPSSSPQDPIGTPVEGKIDRFRARNRLAIDTTTVCHRGV